MNNSENYQIKKYIPGIEIKTKLRPLRMDDLDNCMSWVNDKDIIGNFAHFNKKLTRDEEAKYLENLVNSENTRTYAIETLDGNYLGNIGLNKIFQPTGEATLSIIIGKKDYWGKGYGQSALVQLLDVAFNEMKLHRVEMICFNTNKKTQHVVEKCGFVREGTQRKKYLLSGEYRDVAMMAVLEEDYFKLTSVSIQNNGGRKE